MKKLTNMMLTGSGHRLMPSQPTNRMQMLKNHQVSSGRQMEPSRNKISFDSFAPTLMKIMEQLSEVKNKSPSCRCCDILFLWAALRSDNHCIKLNLTSDRIFFLTPIICCWQFHYGEREECKLHLGFSGAEHLSGFMSPWETIMYILWAHSHF